MTDPTYTHFAILADRTGSMGALSEAGRTRASDTTVGVRNFILEEAEIPGKATFSLVQFMASPMGGQQVPHIDRIAWFTAPTDPDWNTLTTWVCAPYGNTPLLDAIGTVITDTGMALAVMHEDKRPGKVYFVIATDGEENVSKEYTLEQVRSMVAEQKRRYQWEFVFIGVGIDAFSAGHQMGFSYGSTLNSAPSKIGQTYTATAAAVSRSRASGQSVAYTDAERDSAKP